MKKSMTICAVLCLMLSLTCVSWASAVYAPQVAPSWWNSEAGELYAYGYWQADILGNNVVVSPPNDTRHWASNYLINTDFTASIGVIDETITLDLGNEYHPELDKQIFIYITGNTTSTILENVDTNLNTGSGIFTGTETWTITENGAWIYMLDGQIHPQPGFVSLTFTVPGMTSVTNMWAGENCIVPEPATMSLLALGGLTMLRRRILR